jgi:hypothetical protein
MAAAWATRHTAAATANARMWVRFILFSPVLLFTGQAAAFQQRLDHGIAAAEVAEQVHGIGRTAARQQGLAEVVAVLAQQAAVFLEPFDGVGVQLFAPQVGVVAGRVAAEKLCEK